MNRSKIFSVLGVMLMLLLANSCADEDLKPIITFDDAGKGAYPRRVSETDKLINLFDVAGSTYTYTIEFVDIEQGNLVAEYALELVYEDTDPDNGDNSTGPVPFRSWSAGDFETNADGFKGLSNISITGTEAIAAAGTTEAAVSPGDQFKFQGRVVLTDGSVFRSTNSSATVNGGAFRGHFDFTLAAGCPSDLTGTYDYATTDVWCDGSAVTGSVEILSQGGGVYNFKDWSFGAYGPCYGSIADQPGITFTEVCSEVSFTSFVDSFGDTWTFDSAIDGETWTINWDNTYGESAKSAVTFPGGVPFTLK